LKSKIFKSYNATIQNYSAYKKTRKVSIHMGEGQQRQCQDNKCWDYLKRSKYRSMSARSGNYSRTNKKIESFRNGIKRQRTKWKF
jgi:hypothetical protein